MATISKYQTSSGATLYRVRYRTPDNRRPTSAALPPSATPNGSPPRWRSPRCAGSTSRRRWDGSPWASWDRRGWTASGVTSSRPDSGRMRGCGGCMSSHAGVHTRVSDIRFTEVQAWVSELAARRGPVIVQMSHSVLARILDDAVHDRLLAANPARGVKLPPVVQAPERVSDRRAAACAGHRGRSVSLAGAAAGHRRSAMERGRGAAGFRRRFPATPRQRPPQRGDADRPGRRRHAQVREGPHRAAGRVRRRRAGRHLWGQGP